MTNLQKVHAVVDSLSELDRRCFNAYLFGAMCGEIATERFQLLFDDAKKFMGVKDDGTKGRV